MPAHIQSIRRQPWHTSKCCGMRGPESHTCCTKGSRSCTTSASVQSTPSPAGRYWTVAPFRCLGVTHCPTPPSFLTHLQLQRLAQALQQRAADAACLCCERHGLPHRAINPAPGPLEPSDTATSCLSHALQDGIVVHEIMQLPTHHLLLPALEVPPEGRHHLLPQVVVQVLAEVVGNETGQTELPTVWCLFSTTEWQLS